jgi:hypothetical protein
MFVTDFTTVRHSQAGQIQPTPSHPISLTAVLILLSHLGLGFASGVFPSGCRTKTFVCIYVTNGTECKLCVPNLNQYEYGYVLT